MQKKGGRKSRDTLHLRKNYMSMQFSTFAIKYLRKNKNVPINLFFRSYGALVKSFKQKNRRKAHDTPSHEILENLITSPKWTDELGTENLKLVKNYSFSIVDS